MSAIAKPNLNPADPSAWTLRDEIAMRAVAALMVSGKFGTTGVDGEFHRFQKFPDYTDAAYELADCMLRSREA
ncbi:hypothetical protein [Xanthomonas citri]|uniref:hypothetical protein n=1 Tax=Xanthomonas citri TaxID=346 RepID=UPI0010389D65|nr:hypothetical protein [Xanthomonas citri]MCC8492315.1 hypothetical protein [Xanthomonas citri pv. fuscans]TBW96700.1 hypothetical protein TP49_11820 [Xanthomonas citri pv. aurantifolii]TBX03212.1 hypothetical protein TP46_12320 [Xanthomonas citri pv. aurantifolii]